MQIILLEKIVNVGDLGDVVKVKQGYARNFLIPQGKAKRATPENIKMLEAKRAELEAAAAQKLAAAREAAEKLEGFTVEVTQKAGVDGRLFGSVTNVDIVEGAEEARVQRREGVDPDAGRAAEAGRRSSARGRRPSRRGGEHHRSRDRRDRDRALTLVRPRVGMGAGDGPFFFGDGGRIDAPSRSRPCPTTCNSKP